MASMNIKPDMTMPSAEYDPSPTIYLNDDQVEALGITKVPAPGSVLMLRVRAVVSRVTAEAEEADETAAEGNGPDICLTLTCTDMEIAAGGRSTSLYE